MPGTVQDLTNTLLTSIDSEGNVKDMTLLLSVIKELEISDVTAEDLKVTRLGKFINLIRRKLADVDKKLSKRLKKLVKQWLQLVPPKLPNGATPSVISTLSTTPTFDDVSDKGRKSASIEPDVHVQMTNNGHTHLSGTRVVSPHPSSLVRSHSPSILESYSQNSKASTSSSSGYGSNVGSMESDSSQEVYFQPTSNHTSAIRNSTSPTTPPSSPTPHESTLSSRPNQPVSINPTRNRSKLLHKLSGLKSHLSPSKDIVVSHSLQSSSSSTSFRTTSVVSTNLHSLHNSSSSNSNSLPTATSTSHQSILQQPSSPLFSPGINIAIDSFSGETSPAAWTSKQAEFYQTPDFSAITGTTAADEVKTVDTLNGISSKQFLNVLSSSRKRQRSDSPLSNKSTSPHKRHKKHKHNSAGKILRHVEDLVVSVPLTKVTVRNSSRKIDTITNRSPNSHAKETWQLIVRIDRAALKRSLPTPSPTAVEETRLLPVEAMSVQPTVGSIVPDQAEKSTLSTRTKMTASITEQVRQTPCSSNVSASRHSQSPSKQAVHQLQQDQCHNQCIDLAHGLNKSPPDSNRVVPIPRAQPLNLSRGINNEVNRIKVEPESLMECNVPDDAVPGVNGCIGNDGNWYTWEDHIPGNGIEVTVLPYVFIDM